METVEMIAFVLRIASPVLALITIILCFVSMNKGKREDKALALLYNETFDKTYEVMYWENLIGRNENSDIVIEEDMTVSRTHAVLFRRNREWFISDVDSKAGVFVNGQRIKKNCRIRSGDKIQLGSSVITLKPAVQVRTRVLPNTDARTISGTLLVIMTAFYVLMMAVQAFIYQKEISVFMPSLTFIAVMFGYYFASCTVLKRPEFELETIAFVLSGTGIVMSSTYAMEWGFKQIISLVIGLVIYTFLIWFIKVPDRTKYQRYIMAFAALGLVASAAVFGKTVNGASNWVYIGGMSLQPAELAKIAYMFICAGTLDRIRKNRYVVGLFIITMAIFCMLYYISDIGMAVVFFGAFLIAVYLWSGSRKAVAIVMLLAAAAVTVVVMVKPYIADRFKVVGHVWEYAKDESYQQAHSLIFGASGGFFGLGIGNGNLRYITISESDLMFSVLSEEAGLLQALILVCTIGGLVLYARSVTVQSRSVFYSMAACTASGLLVFQTALHIFGGLGMIPMTGLTLPFISYGGTSMMACWGLLAFIKSADERTYYRIKPEHSHRKRGEVLI